MNKNYLSYGQDLYADVLYALENEEDVTFGQKDAETLKWLIQRAKCADMYEKGLHHVVTHDSSSKGAYWAKEVLHDAVIRFEPKEKSND